MENNAIKRKTKESSFNWKEAAILGLLFVISVVSVFGIYNVFTVNLIGAISKIPSDTERYANYAIIAMIVIMFAVLQTVNMKKKDAFGKIGVILFISAMAAATLLIVLFFTKSLIYPLLALLIIGMFSYMLDLVFSTIGAKGFFAFLLLFGLGIVGVYRAGVDAPKILISLGELAMAMILFVAAVYPRVKALFFHIGTRDNIDISNASEEPSDHDFDGEE